MAERYLVIDGSRAYLANEVALRRVGFASATVLDLNRAKDGFRRAFPDLSRDFSRGEIAAIAGIALRLAQEWYSVGIIQPRHPGAAGRGNAARYTYGDAFACGVIGSLYRAGVGPQALKNAYTLLTRAITIKQEETIQQATPVA